MEAASPELIKKHIKESDFNSYKITAKGTKYTIEVNGEKFIDKDFPKLPGKDAKAAPTEGIIAFQVHAGYPKMKVEYTEIKFTKLK